MPCVLRPGCKINLYLRITGVCSGEPDGRHAGWHELDTLFLPLPEPHDELALAPDAALDGVRLSCADPAVDPLRNTVTRAYELYAEGSGFRPGLEVRLRKGIPSGAGLGGGSADAAALLLWLEAHAPSPVGLERLLDLAVRTGADVPFFLHNCPCRATGIGDRLTPCAVPELAGWSVVLVCPPVRVSTPEAYAAWDRLQEDRRQASAERQNSAVILTSPGQGATESASRIVPQAASVCWLENSFEEVVFSSFSELAGIKEDLLRCGARAAVMSGSGAALFGLFRSSEKARGAVSHFREAGLSAYGHRLP